MRYQLLCAFGFGLWACGTGTAIDNGSDASSNDYSLDTERKAVKVEVTPGRVNLEPGEQVQLIAKVSGSSNKNVTWRTNKGKIDPNGLYTAPAEDGAYEVTATADASNTAVGKVRITFGTPVPAPDVNGTDSTLDLSALPRTCHRDGQSLMRVNLRVTDYLGTQNGRNGVHEIIEGSVTEFMYNEDPDVIDTHEVHVAMNISSSGNTEGLPQEIPLPAGTTIEIQGIYIPDSATDSLSLAVLHFTHAPCGYVVINGQKYE